MSAIRSRRGEAAERAARLLAFCVVLAAGVSYAAPTYYVSTSGSDANDGLTPQTAWASLGQVNTASVGFVPGTQVLLERGDTWGEVLTPHASGTATDPIVFGNYGNPSAGLPTLLGSDVVTGFTPVSGSTYVAQTAPIGSGGVGQVYMNHDFMHSAAILTTGTTTDPISYVNSTPNSYYYDTTSSNLYVNTGGAPINAATITATRRPNIATFSHINNIVVNGLRTDETAQFNSGYGFYVDTAPNVTIQNSEADRAGKHNFGVLNSNNFLGKDLVARYSAPDQWPLGGSTAYVSYADYNYPGTTNEWDNISASDLDARTDAFIAHGSGVAHVTVNNINAPGYNVFVMGDVQPASVTFNGGTMGSPVLFGTAMHITGATLTGPINFFGSYNVVDGVTLTNFKADQGYQTAVLVNGWGNIVKNSVFNFTPDTPQYWAAKFYLLPGGEGTVVQNNIFSGPGGYINNHSGVDWIYFVSDNNTFDSPPQLYQNGLVVPNWDESRLTRELIINGNGGYTIVDLNHIGVYWQQNVVPGSNGDLNGDGRVDIKDLNYLGQHWMGPGNGTGFESLLAAAGAGSVPEPGSIGVVAAAGIILGLRRRRPGMRSGPAQR